MLTVISGRDTDENIIQVKGDVDMYTCGPLAQALRELREAGKCRVSIDLREAGIVDSSGIKILIQAHEDLRMAGGHLQLLHLRPHTRRVLRILDLEASLALN